MPVEIFEGLGIGAFSCISDGKCNVDLPHARHLQFESPSHPYMIAPLPEGHTGLRQKKSLKSLGASTNLDSPIFKRFIDGRIPFDCPTNYPKLLVIWNPNG
jgi:hypothetical protein